MNEELVKCPVFGKCGGCSHQDVKYEIQMETKKREVLDILNANHLPAPEDTPVYYKSGYGYRNRMDFCISPDGPALRRRGKFYMMVNFSECAISNTGLNSALSMVIDWFNKNKDKIDVFNTKARKGTLRYAVTRSAYFLKDSSVTFILNSDSDKKEEHLELIRQFAAEYSVPNVLAGYCKFNSDLSVDENAVVIKGSAILCENLCGKKYYYHSQGFFQNNPAVTCDMMQYCASEAGEGYDTFTDLFGGVGTFGVFMNDKAKEVLIIDNSKSGIECAVKNIEENKVSNAAAYCCDAMELDSFAPRYTGKRNLFVLDPPRAGLHKNTVKFLNKVLPEKMIYVSCNPKQLAQDLVALKDTYEMKKLAIFDMFPQTRHIESIAVLEKR